MLKYNEKNIPEGMFIKVIHLHTGNTSKNQMKKLGKTNAKFITIARLYMNGIMFSVGEGIAACSKKDSPSRRIGRSIAIGRALKGYLG